MRERVGQGEVDRRSVGEQERSGRQRGRGPRPVRPRRPVVAVRPAEVPRPVRSGARPVRERWSEEGPRVLARRPVVRCAARYRLRRAVAGLGVALASAVAVVALGLLARVAQPDVPPSATDPVAVTVAPGETVWEVADRVAPALSGPERAALAQRIVADNGLTSVRPEPGRVLRVAGGGPSAAAADRSSRDPTRHAA